jgi:hypothetical protein
MGVRRQRNVILVVAEALNDALSSVAGAASGCCQVDAEGTKLALAKPPGRPKRLYEGSTGRISPRGEGLITCSPVLIGR